MPAPSRKKASAPVKAAVRAPRTDGAATRMHLLETAGEVFAERGFADATSKEICERAGTPMASVNYHFGSRDALYEAVLIEAHGQIVDVEDLVELTREISDPRLKLRTLLTHLAGLATRRTAHWGFRVMLREVMSPSPMVPAVVEKAIRPKSRMLLALMGEVLELPPDHSAVQRALAFSVLPSILMLIVPKEIPARLLPAIDRGSASFIEDLMCYVMAGLDALACAYRPAKRPARAASRERA
jgi:AcrR family transcriptional regulator